MGYLVFILSVLIIGIFTGYEIALYVRKRPKNIEKLLGAVLVGTNFFHILSSIVLNELILKFYPKESSVFISGFITTIFVVLLGEYIPKILASLKPDLFIKYFTKVVSFFGNIFYPIIIALEKSSKIIENKEGNKKEILYLIWRKEKEGFLTREYSLILKRVANFEKEKIRKAIRTDKKIITARIGENIKNMREFIKKNYSKINKWILLLKNNNLYEIAGLVELISIFKNESWEEILKEKLIKEVGKRHYINLYVFYKNNIKNSEAYEIIKNNWLEVEKIYDDRVVLKLPEPIEFEKGKFLVSVDLDKDLVEFKEN